MSQAWAAYLDARRKAWGERHYQAHLLLIKPGGVRTNRLASGMTAPLHPLMALPLRDITAPVIKAWTAREAAVRTAEASLAWLTPILEKHKYCRLTRHLMRRDISEPFPSALLVRSNRSISNPQPPRLHARRRVSLAGRTRSPLVFARVACAATGR